MGNKHIARKCPSCGSVNVRHSSLRVHEISARHYFIAPYRCRDCHERFWLISRRSFYLVGIVGIVVIALFGTWLFMSIYETDTLRTEVSAARSRDAATIIKLAAQNDPVAEYELAHMYGAGDGMTKSEKEARKWLGRAALHGFTAAQYELGVGMRDGRGMIQDYQGAVKWLRLAAESGHSRAQFDLASMYRFGKGT